MLGRKTRQARAEREKAERDLQTVRDRWADVRELARRLREDRERNGIREQLEAAFREGRRA